MKKTHAFIQQTLSNDCEIAGIDAFEWPTVTHYNDLGSLKSILMPLCCSRFVKRSLKGTGYGRESFIQKFPGDLEEQRAGLHQDPHSGSPIPIVTQTMREDLVLGTKRSRTPCWVPAGCREASEGGQGEPDCRVHIWAKVEIRGREES